jgi:hypothetical protein
MDCSKCNPNAHRKSHKRIGNLFLEHIGICLLMKNFICQNVQDKAPTRIPSNRRGKSNALHLPVNAQRVRVCKKFFLNTRDIGKKTVTFAMQNKQHGTFV